MNCRSAGFVVMLIASGAGCDKPRKHNPESDRLAAAVAGPWRVVFWLGRSPFVTADTTARSPIAGQIDFLVNNSVTESYPGLSAVADYGSYDIDFSPFGFPSPELGRPTTAVAGSIGADSVVMILSPDQKSTLIRMVGRINGDSIAGRWTVSFPRAGSGGGAFVMWRRP